uniref:Ig-like domain-containing protein n=1 Tax=Timema bartmani TaxID=61472 RepID=A0A7R9HZ56_9NEOP|nr:unnamed protein product [Timema bartmani]
MAGMRTTILGAHLVVLMAGLVVGQQSLFRSVPTTVKTSENDTVLLPCYVDNLVFEAQDILRCVQKSAQAVVGGQQVAGVLDVVLCAGGHKVWWWEDSKLLVLLTLCCVQVVTRWSQGLVVGGQKVAGVLDVVLCAGGHKVWWWEDRKLLVFLTLCCVQVVTRRSQGLVVGGQQVAGVLDVVLCAGGHKVRWWWGSKLLVDSSDPDVTLNSRIKIFPNNTLQVSDLRAEDTGEYKCQVIRPKPWGLMEQLHAIEVLYPPSVVPHPGTGLLEVQLGGDVDMGCEAKGVPKPIITWTNRHGDEMQLLDHRPRLRFRADDRQLSGTYTCVAINGVGEPANATIHLRILYIATMFVFIVSRGLTYLVRMGVKVERVESQSLKFGRVEMVGDVRLVLLILGQVTNALTVVAMERGFQVLQYLGEFMLGNQVGDPKLSHSRVPLAGVGTGGGGEGVWPWRSR